MTEKQNLIKSPQSTIKDCTKVNSILKMKELLNKKTQQKVFLLLKMQSKPLKSAISKKALGTDEFYGTCLKDPEIKQGVIKFVLKALNNNKMLDYLKEAKMILLTKTNSAEARIENTRPIMILSHLTKIIEKCIKLKLEATSSQLLGTKSYQAGFKAGISTAKNLAIVVNQQLSSRRKITSRKINISLDLSKAYDSVVMAQLLMILENRAKKTGKIYCRTHYKSLQKLKSVQGRQQFHSKIRCATRKRLSPLLFNFSQKQSYCSTRP